MSIRCYYCTRGHRRRAAAWPARAVVRRPNILGRPNSFSLYLSPCNIGLLVVAASATISAAIIHGNTAPVPITSHGLPPAPSSIVHYMYLDNGKRLQP